MTGALVLPVGLPLGPRQDAGAGVASVVRLGWEARALGADQTAVWGLARGLAGDDPVGDRELLLQRAAEVGVARPHRDVADLLGAGLLVSWDPGRPSVGAARRGGPAR